MKSSIPTLLRHWSTFKKGLLLCHTHADADSLATAAGLQNALGKKWTIGVPDRMNANALTLAQQYDVAFVSKPTLSQYDAIICCDFSSYEMAGSLSNALQSYEGIVFVVDHHPPSHDPILAKETLLDTSRSACSEIAYQVLKKSKKKIPTPLVELLITGILSDSYYLHAGNQPTFSILAELLSQTKTPYSQLREMVELPPTFSEKLAVLKSAKRVQLFRSQDWIVAQSPANFFQSSCANRLIQSGADVALVAGTDNHGQTILSARLSERFSNELDFNLARDLINPLVKRLGGNGGGHAKAASYRAEKKDANQLLESARRILEENASKKKKGFSLSAMGE